MTLRRIVVFVGISVLLAGPAWAGTPEIQVGTDLGTRTAGGTAVDSVSLQRSAGTVAVAQSRAMHVTLLGRRFLAGSLTSSIERQGGAVISTLLLEIGDRVLSLPGNRSFHCPLFKVSHPYQFGILSCALKADGAVAIDTRSTQAPPSDSVLSYRNGLSASLGSVVSAEVGVRSAAARVTGTATPVAGDLSLATDFHLSGTELASVAISSGATLSGCAAIDLCLEFAGQVWKRELAHWSFGTKTVYARSWTL